MSKKTSALADLDITAEGLNQQDGLAERIARNRAAKAPDAAAPAPASVKPDHNAWRKNKSLLQVLVDEDSHVELSIIAKRRRSTLSKITKEALNDWLAAHGHTLRLPE